MTLKPRFTAFLVRLCGSPYFTHFPVTGGRNSLIHPTSSRLNAIEHYFCFLTQVCKPWIMTRGRFGRRIRFFLTLDTITARQYFNSRHFLSMQTIHSILRNAQGT